MHNLHAISLNNQVSLWRRLSLAIQKLHKKLGELEPRLWYYHQMDTASEQEASYGRPSNGPINAKSPSYSAQHSKLTKMGGAASRLDEILNGSIRLRYFKLPEGSGQQLLDHFLSLFTTSKLKYAVLALAAYYVLKGISIAIYRLWFHPLARFPGPFLARISTWWEFYYEVRSSLHFKLYFA